MRSATTVTQQPSQAWHAAFPLLLLLLLKQLQSLLDPQPTSWPSQPAEANV